MANLNEKVIFLSHASEDKSVVQAFVNHIFDEDELKKNGYKLFFTDTANLKNRGVAPGAKTWEKMVEHLHATVYFFAFLSEDFFESPWCIAELAIFQDLQSTKDELPPPVTLVIDNDVNRTIRNLGMTQALKIPGIRNRTLKGLMVDLKSASIPIKPDANCETCKSDMLTAISERRKRKEGEFFELARRHFTRPRTSDNPVSFFVARHEYEQTAINMGTAAREKLLWTVFQSPLLVADAYDHDSYLMPYDLAFEGFEAVSRVRLVIFRSKEEAAAYDSANENWHNDALRKHKISKTLTRAQLIARKANFQASASKNGGDLLFTEVSHLPKCINTSPPPTYDEKSFLEFAYSDYGQGAPTLLMETGFSSPFSLEHGSGTVNPLAPAYGHVTFYRELKADAQKRIKEVRPYDAFYSHLGELWQIAESVFRNNLDPTVFVRSDEIDKLHK